ncbi:ModE family transcriptional regulator [Oceanidesulfovibrio indonesiensis]|uniref:ModE family transcriptional regulator n=1 Tax=Oceanidesulfovibrio indonesiensis TaxID=54767 RepID=A0A7M3MF42_9BACT|nr:ModE family transcriptional regulator [Oceanidesulfovibrio indonesiensis]
MYFSHHHKTREKRLSGKKPTLRLNIWIEEDGELLFGSGRAQLLINIREYGSLKKASEVMGISYRAAWGKLKKTEEILGEPLVEKYGGNRAGYSLSPLGERLMASYAQWFEEVERFAVERAGELLPWNLKMYEDAKEE